MKRVVVLPSDDTACGTYRMRMPAGAVQQIRPDWQIDVYHPGDIFLGVDVAGRLNKVQGLPHPKEVDLLVMQRVATAGQVDLLRFYQTAGTATVIDSDDAMWCIDPANSAYRMWNHGPYSWRNIDIAARIVDIVTVTTTVLANRYGQRGHAEVLPNCVPGELATVLESVRGSLDQTPTLGWAGFTATHPGDLRVVGTAVKDVVAATGCHVRVIADAEGASREWGCGVEKVNPTPIGLPYYTALTTLDVGLVPLRDSTFNRGKSWLKALEFAACGVAVVASDTPANRLLSKSVPIRLAASPHQWYEHLEFLVQHPDEREAQVAAARDAVFKHHTYEAMAEQWATTWERAIARREKMRA